MTSRKCRNCFQVKPLEAFYVKRWKGRIDHQYHCKACHAEVVRGYARAKRGREIQARWDRVFGRTA